MKIVLGIIFSLIVSSCSLGEMSLSNKAIRHLYSYPETRFKGMKPQIFPWSCGIACLTIILTEGFDAKQVDEMSLITEFINLFPMKARNNNGLTMGELSKLAEHLGYVSMARKLTPDQLKDINLPIIIRIQNLDGPHFIILKGNCIIQTRSMTYAEVIDPALGNRKIPLYQLKRQWLAEGMDSGAALLIQRKDGRWHNNSSLFSYK
jgi:ABC-type bacteriocin/lantibiotic exporter with double-glycine peptidase domain